MIFILKGSLDSLTLNAGKVATTKPTFDDGQKENESNVWSSEKIIKHISDNAPFVASGNGSIVQCVNNAWNRIGNLSGNDEFSRSIINADKLGVRIPRIGIYLFSFYIFEGVKTANSYFSIETKTTALASTGGGIITTLPNGSTKCPIQCCRIMIYSSLTDVDFRFLQYQSCSTFESFNWSMEELL